MFAYVAPELVEGYWWMVEDMPGERRVNFFESSGPRDIISTTEVEIRRQSSQMATTG